MAIAGASELRVTMAAACNSAEASGVAIGRTVPESLGEGTVVGRPGRGGGKLLAQSRRNSKRGGQEIA